MKREFILTVAILCIAYPSYAFRIFDGHRKGFTLEASFGPGVTTVYSDYIVKDQVTRGALSAEVKIGVGGSDQYQVYLINKLAIIDFSKMSDDYSDYFDKMSGEGLGAVFYIMVSPIVLPFIPYASSHSLLGIGLDYYFSDTVPSYFVGGGVGGSFMYDPTRGETDDGAGFFLSGGYEFEKHLQVKLDIMYGFTTEEKNDTSQPYYDPGPQPKTKALSFLLTIGFHAY
jgi:hypothetical protein